MKILMIILVFLLEGCAMANEKLDIFGYYEPQLMGAEVKGQWYHTSSNKLRLDIQSTLDNISFGANFDYITYHGRTRWNILDFLSDDVVETVPQGRHGYYVIPFEDRTFLDNAYARIALEHVDVTVGKQQISLGAGYVWNPTDIFNVKDVLDPTYEQPGHNAVRLDFPMGQYRISGIYAAKDTWENSAKLIEFKGALGHMDYSLLAIEKIWQFHDYTAFDAQTFTFQELPERRRLYGAGTAGELFGLGLWTEYAYNDMQTSDDFYELVVGLDYTFDFQTYLTLEVYRNTLAKNEHPRYDLNDWMRYFAAEQKAIARDQLYLLIQHPITDFITLGASTIYAVSDNSLAVVPMMYYSFAENMEFFAYVNFNIGQEGTAYSKQQGNGLLMRARIYF
ncbi:hypothetical protein JXA02_02315 [candidate division KSB1 bacterium]|nr:hypothetical protein [candidate division KSB1 bacterium]RQW10427.1 MAG: hypothetical protein EH222_02540 [candidate division KSB1 bacterium]